MNLRQLVNQATVVVNANTPVTVLRSTGYTIGAGRKQVPSYAAPVSGFAQLQPLSQPDLKQLDGLNIQGTMQTCYLTGTLAGVVRPDGTGGDIVQIAGRDWLVVKVLEAWVNQWTKVVIVLQGGS